jgi:hypothetical protein
VTTKKAIKKKTTRKSAVKNPSYQAKKEVSRVNSKKKKTRTKKTGNVISVNTDETKIEEVSNKLKEYLEPVETKMNSSVLSIDSHLASYPSTYVFTNSKSFVKVPNSNINEATFQKSDGFRQIVIRDVVSEDLFNRLYECEQDEVGPLINLKIIPMIESLYYHAGHDHNKYTIGYYFASFKSVDSDFYIEKIPDSNNYALTLNSFCSPLNQVQNNDLTDE